MIHPNPRGALLTVSLKGLSAKPRPALVLQSDLFAEFSTVVVIPVTSHVDEAFDVCRVLVEPSEMNGLRVRSHIMVDKIRAAERQHLGEPIGLLEHEQFQEVTRKLMLFLGLAEPIKL